MNQRDGFRLAAGVIVAVFLSAFPVLVKGDISGGIDWSRGEIRIISVSGATGEQLASDVAAKLWLLVQDIPVSSDAIVSDYFASFDEFEKAFSQSNIAFTQEEGPGNTSTYIAPLGGRGGLLSILPSLPLSPSRENPNIIESKREPVAIPQLSCIIFDLTKVDYSPVMAPRIVDELGRPAFEVTMADMKALRARGMVGFARTLEDALADPRAGANPLVVRAISANQPRKGDIGVSSNDLAMIQQNNSLERLLTSCNIVIVTD